MIGLAFKTLLFRRGRLVLTLVSIVLGVAFMTATLALTASIRRGTSDTFAAVASAGDVVVRYQAADGTRPGPLPTSTVTELRAVDGVEAAEGVVRGAGLLGRPGSTWSSTTVVGSASGLGGLSPFRLRQGRAPAASGEVVVDHATFQAQQLRLGDTVMVHAAASSTAEIVGTVALGDVDGIAGTAVTLFDLDTAERLTDRAGRVDEVLVSLRPGSDAVDVTAAIHQVAPGRLVVVDSAARAAEQASETSGTADLITLFLGAFAVIAMGVGAFVILNTFTVTVAQRTQELGLLRAIGASRRQVTRAVTAEAAAVGILGSSLGVVIGLALTVALRELSSSLGLGLPDGGFIVSPRTVAVPLVVGVVLTVVASALPARRAGRMTPMAALGRAHRSASVGRTRIALGVVLLVAGLIAEGAIGAVTLMIATGLVAPLLVPVMANVARFLARGWGGVAGRLGVANAERNPVRTAATASALMIGLSLVAAMTIVAASVLHSFGAALDRSILADFIISTPEGVSLSPEIAVELRKRPQVSTVSEQRSGQFELVGIEGAAHPEEAGPQELIAVDPATYGASFDLGVLEGSIGDLAGGGVIVLDTIAARHGWKVGDPLRMRFETVGEEDFMIRALYQEGTLEAGGFIVSLADHARVSPDQRDTRIFASASSGSTPVEARSAIRSVLDQFPGVRVDDPASYTKQVTAAVDLILATVNILLGLAVLIASLGIVNTLALSMHERTRELGLVRAIGMTKRQVRAMVRWESVVMSMLGSVLGLAVGLHAGRVLLAELGGRFAEAVVYPAPRLTMFVALGIFVGLGAAVLPARRAAGLPILEAAQTT